MRMLTLGFLLSLLVAAVVPARATAEGFQDTKSKARGATALFHMFDPADSCIETGVDIFIVDGTSKGDLGSSAGISALIEIHRSDICNAVPLLGITARPTNVDFQAGAGLASARLSTTVPVTDWVSGASSELVVDVVWDAIGDSVRDERHETVDTPDCKAVIRFKGVIRPAVAQGSVMAFGTNFTPLPTEQAYLSSEKASVQATGCSGS
jgi:hypothetical protein